MGGSNAGGWTMTGGRMTGVTMTEPSGIRNLLPPSISKELSH